MWEELISTEYWNLSVGHQFAGEDSMMGDQFHSEKFDQINTVIYLLTTGIVLTNVSLGDFVVRTSQSTLNQT